jgi:hypothetical protein
MIIWLASYPRSGNTYFRVLLNQYYGLETESIYEIMQQSPEIISKSLGLISETSPNLDVLIQDQQYHFVKTHDLAPNDYPAVYVVRDGRDALVSHAHYHLEFDLNVPPQEQQARFDDTLHMLIESDASFGGWSNNVNSWLNRSAPTAIVKYESLIEQPLATVQNALAKLQYPAPPIISQQTASFEELKQIEPKFFRKGKAGSWREEMSPVLHELFWTKHGATMQKLGYKRGQNIFERTWSRLRHRP